MASAVRVPFLSVEEYLHSSYEPDADYVDGFLEERNLGEFDHGDLQWAVLERLTHLTLRLESVPARESGFPNTLSRARRVRSSRKLEENANRLGSTFALRRSALTERPDC